MVDKKTQERIQNKKVCDVTEYVMPSIHGNYKAWMGSVEDAWFSCAFVKGIISVSISEREMCLGWDIVNFAMVDNLLEALTGKPNAKKDKVVLLYNAVGFSKDVATITFNDVMKVFKWKFKNRNVKVDYHFLNV